MKAPLLAALFALSTTASAGATLDIHEGTLELSGRAAMDLHHAGGFTSVVVGIKPGMGFFVSDHVMLHVLADVTVVAGSSGSGAGIGAGAGAQYFLGEKGLRPYFGGEAGVGDNTDPFVGPVGGVLIPISSAVALDVGAKLRFASVEGQFGVDIPAGALGVRAFF